jgi:hypothetical protein
VLRQAVMLVTATRHLKKSASCALFSVWAMSNDLTESPAPTKHKKPQKDKTKLSDPGVAVETSQKKEKRKKHKANGLFHTNLFTACSN